MRASADDYWQPNKSTDRIMTSYDGYCAYLLIIDGATRWSWTFLTASKEPPIAICLAFLHNFGNTRGIIRMDQGGELARSNGFITAMLKDCGYVVERTGADSPSQNGSAEIFNNTLAVKVQTLLYGSGLPAKFWSAALLHSVFLQNRYTPPPTGHLMKLGTAENQMYSTLKRSALASASNSLASDGANLTATISRGSSSGTLLRHRTSSTST
jgi:hypothetical protein